MELNSRNLDQSLFSPNKIFPATPITKFYSGKSIFITGSTGFLGKVLLGKLITTCPIKTVYVLIKPKRGKSVSERLSELLKSAVFDEVRENNNAAFNNVIPIYGNIAEENLGMSKEYIAVLSREVQVVFHSAASINMGCDLAQAIQVNTKGTAEVVKLCKGMQQLQTFVYVSTAYSNCNRSLIDERVYEPNTSLDAVYDLCEKLDKAENASIKRLLMENRPNSYTYSKSLAEKIIDDEILGIPAVIVRPSVILSSIKTPMPGWIENVGGINKMASAVCEGTLRCWYGGYESRIDMVPVDQVANLLIATAWDADKRQLKKVKVYNCCSGLQNSLTVGTYFDSCAEKSRNNSDKFLYTNMMIVTANPWIYSILWIILQVIPAYLLDAFAWLWGQPGRLRKINASLMRGKKVLEYFGLHSNTFIDHNVRQLLRDMDPNDKVLFDFDFSVFDWQNYFHNYVLGLKKCLRQQAH